jgi:hypothetical protein
MFRTEATMFSSLRARRARELTMTTQVTAPNRAWLALAFPLCLAAGFGACVDDGGTDLDTNGVNAGGATAGAPAGGGTTGGAAMGGATTGGATMGAATPVGAAPGGGTPGGAATGGGVTGGAAPGGGTPGGVTGGGVTGGGVTGGGATPGGGTTGGGATGGGATMGGGTTGGGTTGGGATMGGASNLKTKCEDGERAGCSSFMSPSGMEIELGPYGAAVDANVGKGYENTVNIADNKLGCSSFASLFGQPKEQSDKLIELGDTDLKLYTVFRPANFVAGETYPVVTWGNGTCAKPEGYGTLLRYVASHGFIVIAANSRYVGSGTEQKRALDFLFKANDDSSSPYYQKVDKTRIAAMGHSQGSGATVNAASDDRIKAVILFNGGTNAVKPFLAVSGDRDIAGDLSSYKSALQKATKGAYLWMHMVPGTGNADGHLTLMLQPERLTGATVAWLKYMLLDDADSKTWFSGTMCKLCGHDAEYEFAAKGI